MKITAGEVVEGDEISFTYNVWRGHQDWTPVKTGYREVIRVSPYAENMTLILFRDLSKRYFENDAIVELKQDWDKVEHSNSTTSEDVSELPSGTP